MLKESWSCYCKNAFCRLSSSTGVYCNFSHSSVFLCNSAC